MTQKVEINLNKGTDFSCLFLCTDCIGNPINFDGYSAKIQIKKYFSGKVLDELTSENGRLELDSRRGAIKAVFPNEITATYPASKLLFDIVITSISGFVFRLVEGSIRVHPGVTS